MLVLSGPLWDEVGEPCAQDVLYFVVLYNPEFRPKISQSHWVQSVCIAGLHDRDLGSIVVGSLHCRHDTCRYVNTGAQHASKNVIF